MNKYLKPNEFLKSNYCVIKPIDNIVNEIKNNDSRRIIVKGGRGVGKTLTLSNCSLKTKDTSNPIIFTKFDSIGFCSKELEHIFDTDFFAHYYEVIMSYKLLNYIKEQHNLSNIKDVEYDKLILFEDKLNNYDNKLVNYINNVCYDEAVCLHELLSTGELTEELLKNIKNIFRVDTISLAIDRFDWTNGNNIISQEVLSKYFDMFDKVIITSDDISLQEEKNKERLLKKGYSFINIKYGNDIEFVKEIINKKIDQCNQNIRNLGFNSSNISNDTYQNIVNKANGNISLIMRTTNYAYDTYQWECGEWDVNKCFEFAIDEKLEENKKLCKIMKPPKLYL